MTWGHASSSDMVHWEHEPIAIKPTKGGTDASGCWSGTTVLDTDGTPTMIYTGVRSHTQILQTQTLTMAECTAHVHIAALLDASPWHGTCAAHIWCWQHSTKMDQRHIVGCRRRDNKDCGPLPHAAVDLGLDMIECQMMARCQQGKHCSCMLSYKLSS